MSSEKLYFIFFLQFSFLFKMKIFLIIEKRINPYREPYAKFLNNKNNFYFRIPGVAAEPEK